MLSPLRSACRAGERRTEVSVSAFRTNWSSVQPLSLHCAPGGGPGRVSGTRRGHTHSRHGMKSPANRIVYPKPAQTGLAVMRGGAAARRGGESGTMRGSSMECGRRTMDSSPWFVGLQYERRSISASISCESSSSSSDSGSGSTRGAVVFFFRRGGVLLADIVDLRCRVVSSRTCRPWACPRAPRTPSLPTMPRTAMPCSNRSLDLQDSGGAVSETSTSSLQAVTELGFPIPQGATAFGHDTGGQSRPSPTSGLPRRTAGRRPPERVVIIR